MKRRLLIIFILFFHSSIMAETDFEELFDIHPGETSVTANRVASFHAENIDLSVSEKLKELDTLSSIINKHVNKSPDAPLLWFIKGLNHSNQAAIHSAQRNQQQARFFIDKKNKAYKKAIDTDNTKNILTAAIYSTMKHGLPDNLKIQAIQKEIELGGNGENELYYWYLHWSNINTLKQSGRLQEAEQALINMKAEMRKQGINHTDLNALTQEINQQIAKAKRSHKTEPGNEKSPENTNSTQIFTMKSLTWVLVCLAIIALILAWKYELLIFKKKHHD